MTRRAETERDLVLRRALHALLHEHPAGVTSLDVATQLGLSHAEADAMLSREAGVGGVDLVGVEDGEELWVSKTKIRPFTTARAIVGGMEAERSLGRRAWLLGVGSLVGACGLAVLAWRSSSSAPDPSPAAERVEAVSPPDPVRAREAGEQRRAWTDERADLEQRIAALADDANRAGCEDKWASTNSCYVSHRLMTRAAYEEERARMLLLLAELERALELSR